MIVWIGLALTAYMLIGALIVHLTDKRCAEKGHVWQMLDDGVRCARCKRRYKDGAWM